MRRIKKISQNTKETTLLMSMPGIAEYSALMILAEIGDIHRFPSPKTLVSYAGLCPGIYQSGDTKKPVKNNMVNKWLKWIIVRNVNEKMELYTKDIPIDYYPYKPP